MNIPMKLDCKTSFNNFFSFGSMYNSCYIHTSFSNVFKVFPLGPINKPTKFISGYSSWGIITLSLTRTTGGLEKEITGKNRK